MLERGDIIITISEAEHDIISTIWAEGRPLTTSEIVAFIPNKTWKDSAIHAHINDLIEKGIVGVVGMKRIGRTYARQFGTLISSEDFLAVQLKRNPIYKNNKNGNLRGVFASLVEDEDISISTLIELENLIADRIKEIERE